MTVQSYDLLPLIPYPIRAHAKRKCRGVLFRAENEGKWLEFYLRKLPSRVGGPKGIWRVKPIEEKAQKAGLGEGYTKRQSPFPLLPKIDEGHLEQKQNLQHRWDLVNGEKKGRDAGILLPFAVS